MGETQPTKNECGEKLKKLRNQHQYTQEELAQKLYVSRQTISNWEQGKAVPDYETKERLSKIYKISLGELLSTNENEDTDTFEGTVGDNMQIWQEDERLKKALLSCGIIAAVLLTATIPLLEIFAGASGLIASRRWKIRSGCLDAVVLCCMGAGLCKMCALIGYWMVNFM